MQTEKEYQETLLWIKSDGYKWGLRLIVGTGLMMPMMFIISPVIVGFLHSISCFTNYIDYGDGLVLVFVLIFLSYILGVSVSCFFVNTPSQIAKEIIKTKICRENEIAEIKRIVSTKNLS